MIDPKDHPSPSLSSALSAFIRTPLYTVIFSTILAYGAVVTLLMSALDRTPYFVGSMDSILKTSLAFLVLYLLLRPIWIMVVDRPKRLLDALRLDFYETLLNPNRIVPAVALTAGFSVFFSLFVSFKSFYPNLNYFSWDTTFAHIDEWLHGGTHPWEWLLPVLGFGLVTAAITFFYGLWFFVKFFFLYWQGFSESRPEARAQFFLSILLCWIVNGSILASVFASAGPCYFHLVVPDLPNPYAGLMEYLLQVDIVYPMLSLDAQDYLWQNHISGNTDVLTGISAFPSMHVSVAFIFMVTAWRYGHFPGALLTAFFVVTLVGSVLLGWHYAVDAYASIITSYCLWVVSGFAVRRYRLHEPRRRAMDVLSPETLGRPT